MSAQSTAEEAALKACRVLSNIDEMVCGATGEGGPYAASVADSLRQSAQVLMTEVEALRDAADAIEAQAERLARHAAALEGATLIPCHNCSDGSCMLCDDNGMVPL